MENYIVEQETYKGFEIVVRWDEYADYEDECSLGTFYSNVPRELWLGHDIDEVLDDENHLREDYICVVVYAYIHSGISLSVSDGWPYNDRWDGGLGGVMACTMEEARKWFDKRLTDEEVRKEAVELMKQEVKTLDDYCQGNVFWCEVLDEEGGYVDSCGGFVGETSCAIEYAKDAIDGFIEQKYKREFENSLELQETYE